MHELQPQTGGALRIAASLSVCTYLMPDVMQDYKSESPKVMVHLRSGNSMQVLKMVLEGEAEIGVARSLNHPEVETTTLRNDPLILVGHPAHPMAGKREVRLEEVESWPLIFYDRGSSDWTLSQGLFRRAGLLPNVALEVETIEAAKRMVERKLGFGFLPQIALIAGTAPGQADFDRDRGCRAAEPQSRCDPAAQPPAGERGARFPSLPARGGDNHGTGSEASGRAADRGQEIGGDEIARGSRTKR